MDYRLYRLDSTGHIITARELAALDDLAALAEAEKLCDLQAMEIWQGARYVARVKKGNAPLDSSDRMSL